MNSEIVRQVLAQGDRLRDQRRSFLKMAGGAAAAVGGAAVLSACNGDDDPYPTPTPTPTPTTPAVTDADILNFALNLEYLEAEFYLYATTGSGLPANLRTGAGTQGTVTPGAQVTFTDRVVGQYAREIAADELAHVRFLRRELGSAAVAEPAVDVGFGPTSAFSNAARAAGLIGAGAAFNPYANDETFLLGAFIFEDVGVTAYKGAAPLLTSKIYLEAAAGILAAEAYHAGLVRTILYRKGLSTPAPTLDLIGATEAISKLRDDADNSVDTDQGIRGTGTGITGTSNIVPTDANGIAYSRTAGDVLNIVYLTPTQATSGGFFPSGVNNGNAALRSSSAFA